MSANPPILKTIDGFAIRGFRVRTQNKDEFNPETAKLPNLWQKFYSNNPNPDTIIFGVYSGFESDANGFYDVTAGTLNNNQSDELSAVKVYSGNYLVFEGKGPMPQTVIETWKRVWDYFTEENSYQRNFMTDFEEYKNGDEVAIFIGVK